MKQQFLHANYVERNVSMHVIRILITPLYLLAFIKPAIRAFLAGKNAHPRGEIESEKTHRRMLILPVKL